MKKPTPSKVPPAQKQMPSPAAPVKKEMSAPGSPQKMQSNVPAKAQAAKGPESQKQASPAPAQKMTPEIQRASGSQKPDLTSQTGRKQSSATPAPKQESGTLFGFGGAKTEPAKTQESVTGKMFGFGSIFSSASTLMASSVQDESKSTPPVSPKMQPAKETKPTSVQMSDQDKKKEPAQQPKANPAGQGKVEKVPSQTAQASHNAPKAGQSTCPICKVVLNVGSKDLPNYNTCTECKSCVCNQCGFNPKPNVTEVRLVLCVQFAGLYIFLIYSNIRRK